MIAPDADTVDLSALEIVSACSVITPDREVDTNRELAIVSLLSVTAPEALNCTCGDSCTAPIVGKLAVNPPGNDCGAPLPDAFLDTAPIDWNPVVNPPGKEPG